MDAELLKTVGQIAGIGGLALGVFLLSCFATSSASRFSPRNWTSYATRPLQRWKAGRLTEADELLAELEAYEEDLELEEKALAAADTKAKRAARSP